MFSGFSGLSGWKVFFLADTDFAAILDLAFYLKEPLILSKQLAITVLQPQNFHLAMPNYGNLYCRTNKDKKKMADDFVEEVIEDYKEEDMHFHSSVAEGSDYQHTRLVS